MSDSDVIWINDLPSRKVAAREMITRRLKKKNYSDSEIEFTIDAACFYLDQGDSLYRAIHTAIHINLDDLTTGPYCA